MFANKDWDHISNLKQLTRDNCGHLWKQDEKLNSVLVHLPWWAKDRSLDMWCLLYQLNSKGGLHILCIMYVLQIRTSAKCMSIWYKNDKRHARIKTFRVSKWRWNQVGLMATTPFYGEFSSPSLHANVQQSHPSSSSMS